MTSFLLYILKLLVTALARRAKLFGEKESLQRMIKLLSSKLEEVYYVLSITGDGYEQLVQVYEAVV